MSKLLLDKDGNLYSSAELQQQMRRRHFIKILNIQSQFDPAELENARQRPLRPHMADTPPRVELEKANWKNKG